LQAALIENVVLVALPTPRGPTLPPTTGAGTDATPGQTILQQSARDAYQNHVEEALATARPWADQAAGAGVSAAAAAEGPCPW